MGKKLKLAKFKQKDNKREEDTPIRFHYQVYIQEEQSIHPKDVDQIEY
ncbi:MAG: hypothetical protein LRY73_00935 [Bacillus sp. (in: Bacteria)]|nr:hypothetical protein [Bacillus sp. (in: firmicutes)]